ncbi:MAG: ATP-binding cassette domain-containing protein, partial [Spirochaetales bacterium]|nr:ATP-binding cassette domain-containing protein [Spirochaetales bacterium]
MCKALDSSGPVLQIQGLDKFFGGLHAVDSVSFEVRPGIIKAVIGPNGAGKTTLFNMIAGYYSPSGGQVFFEDVLLTGMQPFHVARQGVFRTFQNLKLSSHLSVLDNILLGRHTHGQAGFLSGMLALKKSRQEEKKFEEAVLPLLEWLNLIDL